MITQADLQQFTGTENYYKHWLGFKFTDGVNYLADKAGAFWLLDVIASWQPEIKKRYSANPDFYSFQVWTLRRSVDTTSHWNGSWVARCEDGNGQYICSQDIPHSDFPLDSAEVWFINGVMLLPSEY